MKELIELLFLLTFFVINWRHMIYLSDSVCVWGAMEIRAISAAEKGNVEKRDGMAFMRK